MTSQAPWMSTPWEPEALREAPMEQLLERSVEFEDATEGLFDRLGAIRTSASESGITVTVTLDGQLTDLTLTDEALKLGGAKLAATIHRLATEAATDALSRGIAVLAPVVGAEVTRQLAAATGLDKAKEQAAAEEASATAAAAKPADVTVKAAPVRPRRPAPLVDDEDFSTLETWAVRD